MIDDNEDPAVVIEEVVLKYRDGTQKTIPVQDAVLVVWGSANNGTMSAYGTEEDLQWLAQGALDALGGSDSDLPPLKTQVVKSN